MEEEVQTKGRPGLGGRVSRDASGQLPGYFFYVLPLYAAKEDAAGRQCIGSTEVGFCYSQDLLLLKPPPCTRTTSTDDPAF